VKTKKRVVWIGIAVGFFWGAVFCSAALSRNFRARFYLEVRDAEKGNPIEGATVVVAWQRQVEEPPFNVVEEVEKSRTDARGRVVLSAQTRGRIRYAVSNTGYYPAASERVFSESLSPVKVDLRRRIHPGPMVALQNLRIPVPEPRKPLPFDLLRLDWLPPYGTGETADVLVTATSQSRDTGEATLYQSVISFEFSGPDNGVQAFSVASGGAVRSTFDCAHLAPEEGYRARYTFEDAFGFEREPEDAVMRAFYFRIRSRRTKDGTVQGFYGRFYGKIAALGSDGAEIEFERFYLQPEYNSRNMEYDIINNLAPSLVVETWRTEEHTGVKKP
jgi:hypothetical protein